MLKRIFNLKSNVFVSGMMFGIAFLFFVEGKYSSCVVVIMASAMFNFLEIRRDALNINFKSCENKDEKSKGV